MTKFERTRKLLTEHCQAYPKLQIQDIFKYLYQSAFGCEHLVASFDSVTENIRAELSHLEPSPNGKPKIDLLDGEYSRVHLSYLACGLSAETLGRLFCASAKKEPDGLDTLKSKLEIAKALAEEGLFSFSSAEFDSELEKWSKSGFPAVRHSSVFREAYKPAYRVISNKYVAFLPLFAKIDSLLEKGYATVALEGGSASGKTTLSEMLSELYDCNVFHMDDFFLRPEQRTAERYAEVGGNIDRERFSEEVLTPLKEKKPVLYRKFDCSSMKIMPAVEYPPKRLTVIEGAYSMHPAFADCYDISAFLDISPALQRERIKKRNTPELAERFFSEWIPLEQVYFSKTDIKNRCDLCIEII